MFTDFRIRLRRFFKKNAKIIFIAICIWVIVVLINMFLKNYQAPVTLETTYEPHKSVMDDTTTVPQNISNPIEEMIEEYVGYCNEADWASAYNMLSEACKEYSFNNSLTEYMHYAYTKMPTPKKYAIQDFSNTGNTYIYQIKYTDDLLATGLTNTTYQYTEEKMIFKKQKDGSIEMAVGNFVDFDEIKNISENEYLKVDVKSVIKYYSKETYNVKLTNRSDYTIVIYDNQEENEVTLTLNSDDIRNRIQTTDIVLEPNASVTVSLDFQKFYDNDDDSKNLSFNSVRVMEQYSGTGVSEDIIQSEIQNAISKFSVTIPVTSKN